MTGAHVIGNGRQYHVYTSLVKVTTKLCHVLVSCPDRTLYARAREGLVHQVQILGSGSKISYPIHGRNGKV